MFLDRVTRALAASVAWMAAAAVAMPFLLPPSPAYRTLVAGLAAVLFFLALALPRAAFVIALSCVACSGTAALAFGAPEPAGAGAVVAAGYLAGSAVRSIYDIDTSPFGLPLLPLWRSFLTVSCVSALSAVVCVQTSFLLSRGVPPPRIINGAGDDSGHALTAIVAALSSIAVAAGFHRAAGRLQRDGKGRRVIDGALMLLAILGGGVALFQKFDVLPYLRAERWREMGRVQSIFSDPSAAGVAAALLLVPVLSLVPVSSWKLRFLSVVTAVSLFGLIGDAGSRAGFMGALAGCGLFILALFIRYLGGESPGMKQRVVRAAGALLVLLGIGTALALSLPSAGTHGSVLLSRIEAMFAKDKVPRDGSGNRLQLYEGAFEIFREHPVAGSGLGTFRFEYPKTVTGKGFPQDNPPSLYLGVLSEMGLAGGVILALLLLGIVRGSGGALTFDAPRESLSEAAAASSIMALIVVFLFGSHLLYPEIAALMGVLTARLTIPEEGRTNKFLHSVTPVALAGVIVLLAGGVVARGQETWSPKSALEFSPSAGVFAVETEPDGRRFRWTGRAMVEAVSLPSPGLLSLAVSNPRPDGLAVDVEVSYDDVLRGHVSLKPGPWSRLQLPVRGSGVLRLRVSPVLRPSNRMDRRTLGIAIGERIDFVLEGGSRGRP